MLIAFPQQQWLRERAPVLRYMYIACLVPFEPCEIKKIGTMLDVTPRGLVDLGLVIIPW